MASNAFKTLQASLISIDEDRKWCRSPAVSSVSTTSSTDTYFEALFVRSVVAFERFLEAYFYEIVFSKYIPKGISISPLASFTTRPAAVAIVQGSRGFADWLPYDAHTVPRARLFLKEGRPFADLDMPTRKQLEEIMFIRHAIAHASQSARDKFDLIAQKHLSSGIITPARFLQSSIGSPASPQDRLEAYIMQLIDAAVALDPP